MCLFGDKFQEFPSASIVLCGYYSTPYPHHSENWKDAEKASKLMRIREFNSNEAVEILCPHCNERLDEVWQIRHQTEGRFLGRNVVFTIHARCRKVLSIQ